MTLPQIISRNQIQKIPTTALNVRKTLSGSTDGDFYTCPSSKKAIIKGKVVCTGLGAAASVNFQVNSVNLFTWNSTSDQTWDYTQRPFGLSTANGGQSAFFEVQIAAGQILRYTQNTGTNAEMNFNGEILETPA